MPTINYKDLKKHLNQDNNIFFLHGESYLIKEIVNEIKNFFILPDESNLSFEKGHSSFLDLTEDLESVPLFSNLRLFLFEIEKVLQKKDEKEEKFFIDFIKKGFLKKNKLIITTENYDGRKTIFKTLNKEALCIECSLSTDKKDKKDMAIKAFIISFLKKEKKEIEEDALEKLISLTDDDLFLLSNEIKKLISYIGEKSKITKKDVLLLISKSKTDPVFLFTEALFDKNLKKTIDLKNSLIKEGVYPLQILSAITNQIRIFLLIKAFLPKKCNYNYFEFKSQVLPKLIKYEERLKEEIVYTNENFETQIKPNLFILSLRHPYSLFQSFLKASSFSNESLKNILSLLQKKDKMLKLSDVKEEHLDKLIIQIIDS